MSGKKDGGRLGKQLGDTLQGLSSLMQMQFSNSGGGSSSLSNDFFNLIKGIGEAKSKLEEDLIIEKEIKLLRSVIAQPDNAKYMREFVVRLMYCEMLGHDVSWGYIHAINMTQQSKLLDKWVGYIAVASFLHRDHELLILLISSLRRDLGSTNQLHVCAALTALSHLISEETIPAVLPLVTELLQHEKAVVRKKAVMALLRFFLLSPTSVDHLHEKVRRALCDADPSVMSATLNLLEYLVEKDTRVWKDIVPTLVSILKQVVQKRLPKHYEYHHVPAPWTQVKILRLLGILGANDKRVSEHMYDTLSDVMKQPTTNNAAYALIYECVKTITSIHPKPALLEAAASSISQFITSKSNNLKYIGIDGLSMIMTIDARHVQQHQNQVVDCLRSPDDTLKRKTLDLLYKMTNPKNVETIAQKLVDHLATTSDFYLRTELVSRITQLAERFSPNNEWFIETMIRVFLLGGDLVRAEIAHNLMQLIAEGVEDEHGDEELRIYAVTKLMEVLENQVVVPDVLVQLAVWVLSEYGYLSPTHALNQIADRLVLILEQAHQSSETRCWIVSGLMKLVAQMAHCPPAIEEIVGKYKRSRHIDLQQRCYEFEALIATPDTMRTVLPLDASCEDILVDERMSFLDDFVQMQLTAGARPYLAPAQRPDFSGELQLEPKKADKKKQLKFDKYADPKLKAPRPLLPANPIPAAAAAPEGLLAPPVSLSPVATGGLSTGGARKWTKAGYQGDLAPAAPTVVPAPVKSGGSDGGGYRSPAESLVGSGSGGYDTRPERREAERAPSSSSSSAAQAFSDKKISKEDQGLFAGLSAGGGDPSQGRGPQRRKMVSGAKPATTDYTTSQSSLLEELNESPVRSPISLSPAVTGSGSGLLPHFDDHPAVISPSASGSGQQLLIDVDFPSPSAAAVAATTTTAGTPLLPPTKSVSIDDLLGGLNLSAPASSGSGQLRTRSDEVLQATPAPTLVMSHKHNGNLDFSNFNFPPHLIRDLGAAPLKRSPTVNRVLSEDGTLHVSHYFVHKENDLALVLFVSNLHVQAQNNITAVVEVPDNLKARFASVEGVDVATDGLRGTFRVGRLSGQSAVALCAFLTLAKLGVGINFKVNVAYTNDMNQPKRLQFTLPLQVTELLRPFPMTTDEYGKKWGTFAQPNKIRKTVQAMVSIQQLVHFMQSQLNLHHIQTIRTEAIACARLVGGNDLVLVHGKVASPTNVELSVRTTDKLFTEAVSRHIDRVLN